MLLCCRVHLQAVCGHFVAKEIFGFVESGVRLHDGRQDALHRKMRQRQVRPRLRTKDDRRTGALDEDGNAAPDLPDQLEHRTELFLHERDADTWWSKWGPLPLRAEASACSPTRC